MDQPPKAAEARYHAWLDYLIPMHQGVRWRWWHFLLLPISLSFLLLWGCISLLCLPGRIMFVPSMILFKLTRLTTDTPAKMEAAPAPEQDEVDLVEGMKARGRFILWPNLQERAINAEGTLIVEQWLNLPEMGFRLWWTNEDVAQLAPMPLPSPGQLDFFGHARPSAFVVWCHERLLHPEHGKAKLTAPPRRFWKKMKDGESEAAFLRRRFPGLSIIETAACRQRCGHCGYDLRATPDRCPECGAACKAANPAGESPAAGN